MINLDLNKIENLTIETLFSKYPELKDFKLNKKTAPFLNLIQKYVEVYCSTMLKEYLELLLEDVAKHNVNPLD